MVRTFSPRVAGLALGLFSTSLAWAYDPYVIPPSPVIPSPGPYLPTPAQVTGKELSLNDDQAIGAAAPLLVPNAESVLGWDGQAPAPGLIQGFDYSGSRINDEVNRQTDALGSRFDALFVPLMNNQSHLVYSTAAARAMSVLPIGSLAPVNPGARPEDIEYELAGAGPIHGKWAIHRVDINSDLADPVFDVDGLELWGGETPTPAGSADANGYSHAFDAATGISVWSYDPGAGLSTPYIPLFGAISITDAVTSLLGPLPTSIPSNAIDLDALMWNDLIGPGDQFDRNDGGTADMIIFSIRQIVDPTDATGFYATGSELFVYDGNGAVFFLDHAGHLWDKAWALTHMVHIDDLEGIAYQLDIDAIESVSSEIPEPASLMLLTGGALALLRRKL